MINADSDRDNGKADGCGHPAVNKSAGVRNAEVVASGYRGEHIGRGERQRGAKYQSDQQPHIAFSIETQGTGGQCRKYREVPLTLGSGYRYRDCAETLPTRQTLWLRSLDRSIPAISTK